jgi:uncharacterized membrane protein YgcG
MNDMSAPYKLILPAVASVMMLTLSAGCRSCDEHCYYVEPPAPLGTLSDDVWQKQEANAEASDFVIYESEFIGMTTRLNSAGEDHVKQIAARANEVPFPIIVEPSTMSRREGDKFGYPIHGNERLDSERRDFVVRAVESMGVLNAEERVVVAPALAPGFEQFEAERAYQRGFNGSRSGLGSGFGGFGGGSLGGGGGFGF